MINKILFLLLMCSSFSLAQEYFQYGQRRQYEDSTWLKYLQFSDVSDRVIWFNYDANNNHKPRIVWNEVSSGDTIGVGLEGGSFYISMGRIFLDPNAGSSFSGQRGVIQQDIDTTKFWTGTGMNGVAWNNPTKYDAMIYNGRVWKPTMNPTFIDTVQRSELTTDITATNFTNTNNQTGWYRVTCYQKVTTAGTAGTAKVTIAWNDGTAATSDITSVNLNGTNRNENSITVYRSSGNVTWTVDVTGEAGSPVFKFYMVIEKLPM